MATGSACGKELPGEFPFCPFCAAPLSEQPPAPLREERKVVTRERAYALLGQGRCLVALGKMEAEGPLSEARELFASMGYKPALLETEALLGSADAAAL